MIIQTDPWSIGGVAAGALVAGAAAGFWTARWLIHRRGPAERAPKEILYLVFSRISHRLKTASEVIRGHLRGIGNDLPRDSGRWKLAYAAIIDEADDINTLIERLDLLVRLGIERQPLVIEPVNVTRMIEDLMVELGPVADEKGVLLGGVVTAPQQSKVYVSGDASALKEVFSNLIENSVRHNGSGTEVKAEVVQRDGQLLVRVSDTGRGIRPETLAGLFDTVSSSYRPKSISGTGMGLLLTRMIVELHHGRITATSTEGKGTEFSVWLPLRRSTQP
jgi:signal transduction histidine kinase